MNGIYITFVVSKLPLYMDYSKQSKAIATADYPKMSAITEIVHASQILKGNARKGLKKRQARSAKRSLARTIKVLVAAEVQTAFLEATKVFIPSSQRSKSPQRSWRGS